MISSGFHKYALHTLIFILLLISCGGGNDPPPQVPQEPYNIFGHIADNNVPIAGAIVSLNGSHNAETTTDSNGFFIFYDLDNGSYTVIPQKADYTFSPSDFNCAVIGLDLEVNFGVENHFPEGAPIVIGKNVEGQIITADTSTITDSDGIGIISYQWLRNGVAIPGATNKEYVITDEDIGTQISVRISYTDGKGNLETVVSAQTEAVENIKIQDLVAEAVVVFSRESSLADIVMGHLIFQTNCDCTALIEINDTYYTAGTGTLHEAYIHTSKGKLEYVIHYSTDNSNEKLQKEILSIMPSTGFYFYGDINPYIDYLIPVALSIYEKLGDEGGSFEVVLLGGIDYFKVFEKESIFQLNERTLQELYDSFSSWYEKNKNTLISAWPFFTEDQLKMIAITNAISYLWHFGNFERIARSGCVQVNELITADDADFIYEEYDGEEPLYWRTAVGMSDYLQSEIGCCTDYAFLSKALLEAVGFFSRRVLMPGHWVTEALIDSSWYTIDATAGTIINESMESMLSGNKRTVYVFFTPYMKFDSPLHYAASIYPDFPIYTMSTGLNEGHVEELSDIQIINGYRDNPPYENELEQINGR